MSSSKFTNNNNMPHHNVHPYL